MSSGREPAFASVRRVAAGRIWHLALGAFAAGLALAGVASAGRGASFAGAGFAGVAFAGAGAVLAVAAVLRLAPIGLLVVAALLGGFAVGGERVEALDRSGLALRPGSEVHGRATLLTAPRPSRFGWSAELELSDGGARLVARAPADIEPPRARIGDVLEVGGRVDRPEPGREFDWAAHLRRRGIVRELALSSLHTTGRRRGGVAGAVDAVRHRAERAIDRSLPGPRAALVRGMVLGQDERIGRLVRDDFRHSGLAHLLAVSGQNVMLLAALALPVLGFAGAGPRARIAVLLGLIALYVPLAGAGPSLQRAGVMGAAGLVAIAAARPASRTYALVLAAAVTLALNPRAVGEPGWQLSFAAVAGIVWLAPLMRPFLAPLPRPLAEGAAITVAATLATAPLVAHHFESVPLAGVPANLLALPAVPLVMWAGMVLCALGQLPAGMAEPASAALGWAVSPLVGYLGGLARRFAELPGGSVTPPLRGWLGLAGAYAFLAGGVVLFRLRARRRSGCGPAVVPSTAAALRLAELGGTLRRMGPGRRTALVSALAGIGALALALALRPPGPPERLTVRFLDVGQGDATLIQHPDGTAVLFDGGPPEARTVRLLRRAGVRRLAVVVATHASRDHHGGLLEVVERMPVEMLLDGGDGARDRAFRTVLAAARDRGARIVPATAPLALRVGELTIRVLSPRPRAAPAGPPPEDANPRAVVALVSAAGFDLLLSADAESEALLPLPLPDVDAMKVPHHGSSDPGLPDVLDRLRPEMAAIEVGADNTYGHPAPSTLAALRDAAIPTWRTDRHGTIALTAVRDGLRVRTER